MADPVFNAFASQDFDPIFSLIAATPHAEEARRVDVADFQAAAREAIGEVVQASYNNHDPSLRVLLIQGRSGAGKTHRLITTLADLSAAGQVYPAVMQLSAKVDLDQISLWILQKLLGELTASHFRDVQGRTPLKRLAARLWAHAQEALRLRFDAALEADDLSAAAQSAICSAPGIRKQLPATAGLKRSDDTLIAALLLLAEDASHEVDAWLYGGTGVYRLGERPLHPLLSEPDRQAAIIGLARIAHATGAPLIIALDQIESMVQLADQRLLTALVTTILQLAENCACIGVVIAALLDTYRDVMHKNIDDSFKQRIEYGQTPVMLSHPTADIVHAIVQRRVERLLAVQGAEVRVATAQAAIAPDWLLEHIRAANAGTFYPRDLFNGLRAYRRACLREQRFLAPAEYLNMQQPGAGIPSPVAAEVGQSPATFEELDKLWSDACDKQVGAVINFSSYDRQHLLLWLAHHVAEELPQVASVRAEAQQWQDAAATRVIELGFLPHDGRSGEHWTIALIDAPNRNQQLLQQIRALLARVTKARLALLRHGKLPGVSEAGVPDRPLEQLRTRLQHGPALAEHFAAGGRVACTENRDWQRLHLAKTFFEQRAAAPDFNDWRRQRRFLLEHAQIGSLARLVQPEGLGVSRHLTSAEKKTLASLHQPGSCSGKHSPASDGARCLGCES
jgi:hypothetical protein